MFDLDALEAGLAGSIFAGRLHFAPVTSSTNDDALTAARGGAPHGSVWFADEQLAGRGRGGNAWRSAAGEGLYVSTLLRLAISAERRMLLPLAAGLAAAEAIGSVAGVAVDLRWPNDLLLGTAKAGGILVEAGSDTAGCSFAVVGIGINVHQRAFDPGLATAATSLDLAAGSTISRQALLIALLRELERESLALRDTAAAANLLMRVEAASSWVRGRAVEVHGPQACAGVTAGLNEYGFLQVETAEGRVTVQTGGIRSPGIH